MKKITYLILLTTLFATSCNILEKDNGDEVLARVYTKYLYKKDIQDLLLKMEGDKDSATIITNYINNWVRQELLLEKAELNLPEEQKNFQKLLEDYRRSLIIYAFEKEWIQQKLDTFVSEEEISMYYQENQSNFDLKENIVKMRYAKVAKNAPKLNMLEALIQGREDSRKDFREYCIQYAAEYNENDSTWMPFDQVKTNLPLNIDDEEHFLKNNEFIVKADSANYYLLYINEYKIKSDISPLSFESETIRNIIINQRKLELISKMKADLMETAFRKGHAEVISP